MFNHKESYSACEHLANVKFVNEIPDNHFQIPIITTVTHGILYIPETYMSLEKYKGLAEEVWQDIVKMCGLLSGVKKKLANPKFIERANPEIVKKEREKKEYYDNKITKMSISLSEMENYIARYESKTRI
jgi:valyl-tRNA synthetase